MNVFTSAFTARSKVVEIGQKKPLSLYLPEGAAIHSVVGKLWITQEGLIDDFIIPAGERFDDPGCFPAMPIEGVVELGSRVVVGEPFAGTDVAAELTAQVVLEAALRQAGEKLAR